MTRRATDAKRANNLEEVARIQEQLAELDGPVKDRDDVDRACAPTGRTFFAASWAEMSSYVVAKQLIRDQLRSARIQEQLAELDGPVKDRDDVDRAKRINDRNRAANRTYASGPS
jgi:hypothetical protein